MVGDSYLHTAAFAITEDSRPSCYGSVVLVLRFKDHRVQVSSIILENELLFDFFVCLHKSSSNKTLDRMRRATSFLFSGITDRRIGQLFVSRLDGALDFSTDFFERHFRVSVRYYLT